ncbi:MAG: hypothetical protein IPJ34_08060 [Myxococcales bacterium]|nr:hypothetical protein [Myxococcales bacterium]
MRTGAALVIDVRSAGMPIWLSRIARMLAEERLAGGPSNSASHRVSFGPTMRTMASARAMATATVANSQASCSVPRVCASIDSSSMPHSSPCLRTASSRLTRRGSTVGSEKPQIQVPVAGVNVPITSYEGDQTTCWPRRNEQ